VLFIRFRFGQSIAQGNTGLFVAEMAPVLSFIVGSLLALQALAEPFEKLFEVPEGTPPYTTLSRIPGINIR
jgi:uncharacterized membrane protein YoaK (UPF0700 family)